MAKTPELEAVGIRIKAARDRAGKTQHDLAAFFGVQQSTVARWEAGETDAGIERIAKMATLFGCEPASIAFEPIPDQSEPDAAEPAEGAA